jgi:hypothetical protein
MNIKSLVLFFVFCLPLLAPAKEQSGNGSGLVGNGAGLVEQNVFFAYQSLGKAMEDCLFLQALCGVSPREQALLKAIQSLQQRFPANEERLQFLSGKENPGFFDTAPGQSHRIAKTGLLAGDTIYFNSDLLYTSTGQPALDLPAIYALLTHELGHQTGNPDHGELDRLGAKLRGFFQSRIQQMRYDSEVFSVSFQIINFAARSSKAEFLLNDEDQAHSLMNMLNLRSACKTGILLGWKLENAHWQSLPYDNGHGEMVLPFGIWMRKTCIEPEKNPAPLEEELSALDFHLVFAPDETGKFRFREIRMQLAD